MNRPGLIFYRGGRRFALDLRHVRRICSTASIQMLPAPAQDVEGVVADGSHIAPVIATPLPALIEAGGRVRVLLVENGESPFGFRVEALEGPRELVDRGPVDALPAVLRPPMDGVPDDAVVGVVSVNHGQAASFVQADPILLLTPAPLYRARSAWEAA